MKLFMGILISECIKLKLFKYKNPNFLALISGCCLSVVCCVLQRPSKLNEQVLHLLMFVKVFQSSPVVDAAKGKRVGRMKCTFRIFF